MPRRRRHTLEPPFGGLAAVTTAVALCCCWVGVAHAAFGWTYPADAVWGPLGRTDVGAAAANLVLNQAQTLYVGGGRNVATGALYADLWWSYDAVNWRTLTPVVAANGAWLWPGGRYGMGFAVASSSTLGPRLVTWGGYDNVTARGDTYYSSDQGATWTAITLLPDAWGTSGRYHMASTTDSNGVIWTAGGVTGDGTFSNSVFQYTFANGGAGQWTWVATLALPNGGGTIFSSGAALVPIGQPTNRLLLIGGRTSPTDLFPFILSASIGTGNTLSAFTYVANMSVAQQRYGFAAVNAQPLAAVPLLVMFGGTNVANVSLVDFWSSTDGGFSWAVGTSRFDGGLDTNRTDVVGVYWRGLVTSLGSSDARRRHDIAVLAPVGSACASDEVCTGSNLFCAVDGGQVNCLSTTASPCTVPSNPCLNGGFCGGPVPGYYPPYVCDCALCYVGRNCESVNKSSSDIFCQNVNPQTIYTNDIPSEYLAGGIGIIAGLVVICFVICFVCYYKYKNPDAKPEDVQKELKNALTVVGKAGQIAGQAVLAKDGADSKLGKGLVTAGLMADATAHNVSANAGDTTAAQVLNNFAAATRTVAAENANNPEFTSAMRTGAMVAAGVAENLATNRLITMKPGDRQYRSEENYDIRGYTSSELQTLRDKIYSGLDSQGTAFTLQLAANLEGMKTTVTGGMCK